MKKVLSACLAVCMACSLAVPAAAAQQTDERLAAVTAQVKQTLNLDTEAYTASWTTIPSPPPGIWTGRGKTPL